MGIDGKNWKDEGFRRIKNFIENYGFTNTLDISVGAMLLFYLKDLKPDERQEAIQSIVIPTATATTIADGSATYDASSGSTAASGTMETVACENNGLGDDSDDNSDKSEECWDSCCENDVPSLPELWNGLSLLRNQGENRQDQTG